MNTGDIEKVMVDLTAASLFISRAAAALRNCAGDSISETPPEARRCPYNAFEDDKRENIHADQRNAKNAPLRADLTISPEMAQSELFPSLEKTHKNAAKSAKKPKNGEVKVSLKQAMDNFRRISDGKDILDLADINRILGFSRSTSGSFVKLAVRRGELGAIPVGREWKFLPVDVKSFIRRHFAERRRK